MPATPEQLYAQREKRFNDVVALKKPDRVPIMPLYVHNFATRIKGISNKDAGYDHETRWQSTKEATIRFGWNFAPTNDVLASDFFAAFGCKQMMWAGEEGGLKDTAPHQWVEGEYVKADELAEFVADPNGFTFSKIFPRIGSKLEGLGEIPLPPLYWFSNTYYLQVLGNMLGIPPLNAALRAMLDVAEAQAKTNAANGKYLQQMKQLGYPATWGAALMPAFDVVSDTLRSLRGGTLDMFRQPDTLLQAVDVMQEATIGLLHAAYAVTGIPRQFIPMHKGAGGFMSDEQFEKFYWPTFKALIEACVDAGITPMPLFEGNYTPRLKFLAELPAGKVAAHFDKIDRKKFKEICGDTMCFWGNVPNSLLATGTPQQVEDDVKELIDLFGDTGLIIDGPGGIPDDAKPENVAALTAAVEEYVTL
jgi:Uroporphyrinogen decarboxylase (URO-D)